MLSAASDCALENILVRRPDESLVHDRPDIAAAGSKTRNDVRADVLVSEKWILKRLHAVILSSQVCSPFSAWAAYWKAAASPSDVSCGY